MIDTTKKDISLPFSQMKYLFPYDFESILLYCHFFSGLENGKMQFWSKIKGYFKRDTLF